MHIILVSNRMATARSITLTGGHLAMIGAGLVALVLVLSSMFSYLTVRHAAEIRMPFLQDLLRSITLEETSRTRELVRENLSTMAVRLGEMQGKLIQLDSLGERIAGLAGVKLPEAVGKPLPPKPDKANSGGPLVRPDNLSTADVQKALDEVAQQIAARNSILSSLEDHLFDERIRKSLLPTSLPVPNDVRGSGFGWRVDPFTGQSALHEGIDFVAEVGTPILAAAAGIVKTAETHPEYGNMIEIDHGNGLITRYGHASKLLVQPGQFIKRGETIGLVGTTGRSTGPHLHFEVRIDGVAQNPARFLDRAPTQVARNR